MQHLDFEELKEILVNQVKLFCADVNQHEEKDVTFIGELSHDKTVQELILKELPNKNVKFSNIHDTKAGLQVDNPKFALEKWNKVYKPK